MRPHTFGRQHAYCGHTRRSFTQGLRGDDGVAAAAAASAASVMCCVHAECQHTRGFVGVTRNAMPKTLDFNYSALPTLSLYKPRFFQCYSIRFCSNLRQGGDMMLLLRCRLFMILPPCFVPSSSPYGFTRIAKFVSISYRWDGRVSLLPTFLSHTLIQYANPALTSRRRVHAPWPGVRRHR